jgi:hypothetical protein
MIAELPALGSEFLFEALTNLFGELNLRFVQGQGVVSVEHPLAKGCTHVTRKAGD